jgi:hypothetical protein
MGAWGHVWINFDIVTGSQNTATRHNYVALLTLASRFLEGRWSRNGRCPAGHGQRSRRVRCRCRLHIVELTRIAGQPTSGVIKDLVIVGGYQEVEIDFVANNPGLTLFHCHQQLHMDFGFMTLLDYTV